MNFNIKNCTICPRECGADRTHTVGFCGEGAEMRISKTMLHKFEEPCISGSDPDRGSGAIFFAGCNLRCVYCQNGAISRGGNGDIFTPAMLADEMLRLETMGAYNINLVTPTHFMHRVIEALEIAKTKLKVPVVFNISGYEKAETIQALDGLADIFLTDFKYGSAELAKKYSAASDYPEIAAKALKAMLDITGEPQFDESGMLRRGIIIRHLVLPGGRRYSEAALNLISKTLPPEKVLLSLMRQYTPDFAPESFRELRRKVTTFEYDFALKTALALGFDGFSQDKDSAQAIFTPEF